MDKRSIAELCYEKLWEDVAQRCNSKDVTDIENKHYGHTALMWAAAHGNCDTVNRLMDAGANIDTRDESVSFVVVVQFLVLGFCAHFFFHLPRARRRSSTLPSTARARRC